MAATAPTTGRRTASTLPLDESTPPRISSTPRTGAVLQVWQIAAEHALHAALEEYLAAQAVAPRRLEYQS
jgi:hypothetical protein